MADVETKRKVPAQARAKRTVDHILEAALQLLERDGEQGFNTNAVAERAGVSIGTLYRYYPDKHAILAALARREMAVVHDAMLASLCGETEGLAPDRAAIRTFLHAFGGRAKARRVVTRATQGVMRAAVMEGADFLLDPEFEDELVRLGRAYLKVPRSGA